MRLFRLIVTPALIALAFSAGCGPTEPPPVHIENVKCRLEFFGLDDRAERHRVLDIVKHYARPETVQITGDDTSDGISIEFVIDRLHRLDEINEHLMRDREHRAFRLRPLFNTRDAVFIMRYDSAELEAKVEFIVKFRATRGAKLFIKPEGEPERDISDRIDSDGNVNFKATLHKGRDYIYARTQSGVVDKYIRIDVYTKEVREIPQSEYPR